MAVQQNRKTRSRRGMRRSHDALTSAQVSTEQASGERHLLHHVSPMVSCVAARCLKASWAVTQALPGSSAALGRKNSA